MSVKFPFFGGGGLGGGGGSADFIFMGARIFLNFVLSKCPGQEDIFKQLRVGFVIYSKIFFSE